MNKRLEKITTIALLVALLEGIVVAVFLLTIPTDPTNAFLLSYSKSRIALLIITLILIVFFTTALLNQRLKRRFIELLSPTSPIAQLLPWFGWVMLFLFWLLLWTPPYRLAESAASYTRLQPLLIYITLMGVQFSLAAFIIRGKSNFNDMVAGLKQSRKWLLAGTALFLITVIVFFGLKFVANDFSGKQLLFPPGAPLSPLQVIIAWLILVLFFLLEKASNSKKPGRKMSALLVFVLIWALTFAVWASITMPCSDDRPGPYPPNFACYPDINDAVYSIGSHYITLGQGVYNQWLTDKPLYMAFLALAQTIAGPFIDTYLLVQIAVIALLPALLFLAGWKKYSGAFGIFLATLTAIQGAYAIALYREVGSVHVKLENPEVLTALVLVLLAYSLFKWLSDPASRLWSLVSGGILAISVLLRVNPFFIAPFVVLAILLNRQHRFKAVLPGLLLFLLAFLLVFSPWFISATDSQGRNHYFIKIEQVLESRFSFSSNPDLAVPAPDSLSLPDISEPSDYNPGTTEGNVLTYALEPQFKGGVSAIFIHFLNNVYTGLAQLPTTLMLHPIREQVQDDIWARGSGTPIWMAELRAENLIALSVNLALVLIGIFQAWRKFGLPGLTGVLIQAGYYTGNAISQTSGGRYLVPVFWILIIYYAIGIFTLTTLSIALLSKNNIGSPSPADAEVHEGSLLLQPRRWIIPVLLGGFLLIGFVLPGLRLIPSQLPDEDDPAVAAAALNILTQHGVSANNWQEFVQDPSHIIIQGSAYHVRFYRSSFYRKGDLSFELMLLAKDHVYIGVSTQIHPEMRFSDGSDVILVGCQIGKDSLWNARRIIMKPVAIIQLDNEKSILINETPNWSCSQ